MLADPVNGLAMIDSLLPGVPPVPKLNGPPERVILDALRTLWVECLADEETA